MSEYLAVVKSADSSAFRVVLLSSNFQKKYSIQGKQLYHAPCKS